MRIVLLNAPNGTTKVGLLTTMTQVRQRWPNISFTNPPNDQQFIDNNLPARMSTETPKPAVAEFGETAVSDDTRQANGTWLQTWTIQTIPLANAKAQLREMAFEIYWNKCLGITPTATEMQNNNADPVLIINARRDRFRTPLNNTRANINNATTVAECFTIFKQLQDAA